MKQYITFGQSHVHRVNNKTFDKDCVAVIEAPTMEEGRKQAFSLFDAKFHNQYNNLEDVKLEYYPRGLIHVVNSHEPI